MSEYIHNNYFPLLRTWRTQDNKQLLRLHSYCLLPLRQSLPTLMEKILTNYDSDTLSLLINILEFFGYQVCPQSCHQKMSYLLFASRPTRQELVLKCVQVSWRYIETFENYKTLPVLAERLFCYLVAGAQDEEFHKFMNTVSQSQSQSEVKELNLSVESRICS